MIRLDAPRGPEGRRGIKLPPLFFTSSHYTLITVDLVITIQHVQLQHLKLISLSICHCGIFGILLPSLGVQLYLGFYFMHT